MGLNRVRLISAVIAFVAGIASCQSSGGSGSGSATNEIERDRAERLVKQDPAASPAATASPAPANPGATGDGEPTEADRRFLESYMASLKYMVYFDEDAGTPPSLMKAAVAQANRYLIQKAGTQPIDLEAIERKKADERSAYEAETGGSVDYIQFLAQKLNADAYVELSLSVTGEENNGKYYSTVSGSAKLYNASSGDLLGAIPMISPKSVGSSRDAADTNAVTAAVWLIMPKLTEQARTLLEAAWKDGIRYDVVIQATADAKAVGQMRRQLGRKVRKVTQESFTAQETRWSVYAFMKGDAIEELMYEAAEFSGMKDAYLVYQRGKSFVFNTGL